MAYSSKKPPRSKRAPQRINSVTIGSHVTRSGRSTVRNTSSKQASFSNPKKSARARRGMVEQVMPETLTGESAADHAKRVNRPHYTVTLKRYARAKSFLIALVATLVILGVAGVAGVFTFIGSVNDKLALEDEMTRAALVPAVEGEAEYTLFLGEYHEANKEYSGPDVILLARMDPVSKHVTVMSIPSNMQVQLRNGDFGRISEAQLLGGDAALIQEVTELTDVSISHIVKTGNEDFINLVDSFGGLVIDVTEEVDDPLAGPVYIPKGKQTLDGKAALTYCRATNFTTGEEMRAENQVKVGIALVQKLLENEGVSKIMTMDTVSDMIQTDLNLDQLISLVSTYQGISDDAIYQGRVPGYSTTDSTTGIRYFIVDETDWELVSKAMDEGQSPSEALPKPETVPPASFEITVRNGSGITGGAQQISDLLTAKGFKIEEVGNADQYVYDETLVIYKVSEMAGAAETVVEGLGVGRTVASNGFYSFDTDILVVVGKDWKPLN